MDITRTTQPYCPECETPVRFELVSDAHAKGVSVDLSTVLVCLSLAEQAGHIPPLPVTWWTETKGHLRLTLPALDSIPTETQPHKP